MNTSKLPWLLGGSALFVAGCASTGPVLPASDRLALGRSAADDPCVATRTWRDPAVTDPFDRSYVITCRSATASRTVGFLRAVVDRPESVANIEAGLNCGDSRPVAIAGVGPAEARRCFDSQLGDQVVVLSLRQDDRRIIASAVPSILGPLEQGVRQLAGAIGVDPDARSDSTIDLASLPPAPAGGSAAAAASDFNPELALQQGINLNHRGRHVEASRVLNDALSRLPAGADPNVRAGLLLEAALADSNISFEESAAGHFERANAILESGSVDAFLLRKRDIYTALDLLNRREFDDALALLDRLGGAGSDPNDPLRDPAIVQALNQRAQAAGDMASVVDVVDSRLLDQLLLQTQAHWARSVALLARGDVGPANEALAEARRSFAPIGGSGVDTTPVLWLQSRLDRQAGRIAAARGDWDAAGESFDLALQALTRGGGEGEGNAPALADLRLERAGNALRRGAPVGDVHAEYDAAIDALVESGTAGAAVSSGLDRYLAFLLGQMDGPARDANQERFFKAVQAAGESGVARQINQLQSVLSADPAVGGRLRDRELAETELRAIRAQIAAADPQDPAQSARLAELEARRQTLQTRLIEIDTALAGDARLATVVERPVTLAEVRSALRPGEVYYKLVRFGGRDYGIAVSADATHVYRVGLSADRIDEIAGRVRRSIDGRVEDGRRILVSFDVAGSYGLFGQLAGPAAEMLTRASGIVVDPGGPLQSLPAAVLITDRASVEAFRSRRRAREFNYSEVAFLGGRTPLSTAVSPRSFIASRQLPPSAASRPFIAFAEPDPPASTDASRTVDLGAGCPPLSYPQLAALWEGLAPIDEREAQVAAGALGASPDAIVRGPAFTDAALLSRDDLDEYKVLHFATHGFPEGVWGCANSPPGLLTSLADTNSNGLLSFSEVARLRLDANLVVLAACDTGAGIRETLARSAGQEEAGATLEGLVRAFLTANARAVMATHWPAPAGDAGVDFVRVFYETARTRPMGESLQAAQRNLIANRETSHPFFWGAYFLVGDAGKTMLGGTASADAGGAVPPRAR